MPHRTILCFGDSNTFGTVPMRSLSQRDRFYSASRWTGVLAGRLGPTFNVIEEGLPGRTTVHDDPIEGASRNGKTYLLPCLESHRPLAAVVMMLGTNDLKTRFSVTPTDIGWSVAALVEVIRAAEVGQDGQSPKILLVSPPPIEELGFLGGIFTGGAAKSRQLASAIAEVAASYGAGFLDAGAHIHVSPTDGIHFEADQHGKLGTAVADALELLLA
jgi:lysophospholipase L1-like esterase